jgi:hypothetical protein
MPKLNHEIHRIHERAQLRDELNPAIRHLTMLETTCRQRVTFRVNSFV